jgi:hypothetical protein
MPGGYKVPAQSSSESLTVISGNFHIGMGDKLDETKAIELTAGGFGRSTGQNEPLRLGKHSHRRSNSGSRAVRDYIRKSGR